MSAWGQLEAGDLRALLGDYPEDAPVRVRVRFPDLGLEVEDWLYELVDSPTGPMPLT